MTSTTRECPLCGGTMYLKQPEAPAHIPGYQTPPSRARAEWMCPDCDYFEEAEDAGT